VQRHLCKLKLQSTARRRWLGWPRRSAACLQNKLSLQERTIVASASTHITQSRLELGSSQAPLSTGVFPVVLPGLLRCLVISWSGQRAKMLQSVAEEESWQAEVCDDVQDFLRNVFRLDASLTVIDLPHADTAAYEELRNVTAQASGPQNSGLGSSLFVICGAKSAIQEEIRQEEIWARQLGVWAYLPGIGDAEGLKLVFAEARMAMAKQLSMHVEACEYR